MLTLESFWILNSAWVTNQRVVFPFLDKAEDPCEFVAASWFSEGFTLWHEHALGRPRSGYNTPFAAVRDIIGSPPESYDYDKKLLQIARDLAPESSFRKDVLQEQDAQKSSYDSFFAYYTRGAARAVSFLAEKIPDDAAAAEVWLGAFCDAIRFASNLGLAEPPLPPNNLAKNVLAAWDLLTAAPRAPRAEALAAKHPLVLEDCFIQACAAICKQGDPETHKKLIPILETCENRHKAFLSSGKQIPWLFGVELAECYQNIRVSAPLPEPVVVGASSPKKRGNGPFIK